MPVLTEKSTKLSPDPRHAAGNRQELDVAYYLRRAFSDIEDVFVFNDVAFHLDGETAQIDHLVVHPLGFAILESKSIYGEVKVNEAGEWSRSYHGNWVGIPSPIIQAEMQADLLKKILTSRAEEFLGKIVGLQKNVGGRQWDTLCVVSNNCILHRDQIPEKISAKVVKSESVSDVVTALTKRSWGWLDSKPAFTKEDMDGLIKFILHEVCEKNSGENSNPEEEATNHPQDSKMVRCKKCMEETKLEGLHGKFGYYVKCNSCGTNTSMKSSCEKCNEKVCKIKKSGNQYFSHCDCPTPRLVFEQKD